jgi:hypothetical protein
MKIVAKGVKELNHKLLAISEGFRPMIEQATNKAVLYVHSTVPKYPAQPEGTRYRRTGTLGREITTEVRSVGSDVVGVIGSPTVYAPWVISAEEIGGIGPQAKVHQGRWWTLQGVVERAKEAVVKIYLTSLQELLKKK